MQFWWQQEKFNHNKNKQSNCVGFLFMVRLPEQVEVLLLHVWQRLQRGVVQPAALDDHLDQVTDADGRNQPAFTGSHVQHCLKQTDSVNQRATASETVHYHVHSPWKYDSATLQTKKRAVGQ